MNRFARGGSDEYHMRLHSFTPEQIFHSELFKDLRAEFLNGEKPRACAACWREEHAGIKSKRLIGQEQHIALLGDDLATYANAQRPVDVMLFFSNTCNLKCRMCNPRSSSRWIAEANNRNMLFTQMHKVDVDPEKFLTNLKQAAPYLRRIQVVGGEPFMTKEFVEFVNYMVEHSHAGNALIEISTNATIYDQLLIDKLQQFKHVSLSLSIDGVGQRFTYMRHPGNWDTVRSVTERLRLLQSNHFAVGVMATINILSLYYIDELIDYVRTFNPQLDSLIFNYLHDPAYYAVFNLTDPMKAEVRAHLTMLKQTKYADVERAQLLIDECLQFVDQPQRQSMDGFATETRAADAYRGESFKQCFPEMAEIVERHSELRF